MSTSPTTRLPKFLPRYCEVYHDAMPANVCKLLIDQFEYADNKSRVDDNGYPTFTAVNVNQEFPSMVPPLVMYVKDVVQRYHRDYPEYTKYIPVLRSLEEFRIKRYNSDSDDRFDEHVDVADTQSANRQLAFLFYLNGNFEGGQTEFNDGSRVTPHTGSVLVFPPFWLFPHAGLPVIKGTKYIMSTYLHLA